jgi:hypothetical protein
LSHNRINIDDHGRYKGYWTSTQLDIDNADLQDFNNGSQGYGDKSVKHAVMQIREFQ